MISCPRHDIKLPTVLCTLTMSDRQGIVLSPKEFSTLQDMLQTYREFTEEVYQDSDWDGTPETLFTETQRRLFTRFDVVSIKYNK